MKDIFDENNRYTARASAIQNELVRAIRKVFNDSKDISPRLLALLAHHAVTDVELEIMLTPILTSKEDV
jgi:hypothetical protein